MRDIAPDNFAFCWRGMLDGDYVAVKAITTPPPFSPESRSFRTGGE